MGKLLASEVDPTASETLSKAAAKLSEASMALTACRARIELARTLAGADKPRAISEGRAALAAFERLGAVPDADAAAAFLRELGVRGRTGPKQLDLLTRRETEVLRLVAQGFSNPEIAERLFISVKTAGHHVSNILTKLGVRSRAEAAAYASTHLSGGPVSRSGRSRPGLARLADLIRGHWALENGLHNTRDVTSGEGAGALQDGETSPCFERPRAGH